MALLLVVIGAAVGGPLRYITDRFIQARHDSLIPWGTFAVNIVGSGLLGFLVGLPASNNVLSFAGVGFCGTLTTFSTFSYETVRLIEDGARFFAAFNVVFSIMIGLAAAYGGIALAGLF